MTYEKKYRIARAGLDHLERAFVDLKVAHEQMRDGYREEYIRLKIERDNLEEEVHQWSKRAWAERNKSWWQKLKETIKTKIK